MTDKKPAVPSDELGDDFYYQQMVDLTDALEAKLEASITAMFARAISNWIAAAGGGAKNALPVSPKTIEFLVEIQGLNQWGYRIVELGPMYTKEQVIAMLEAEMEAPLGEKLTKEQQAAAGLAPYVPPTVDLADAFGVEMTPGYVAFNGNRLQMPAHGTAATNPADQKPYLFWRKGNTHSTGPNFSGYWVLPHIFEAKENQRW